MSSKQHILFMWTHEVLSAAEGTHLFAIVFLLMAECGSIYSGQSMISCLQAVQNIYKD